MLRLGLAIIAVTRIPVLEEEHALGASRDHAKRSQTGAATMNDNGTLFRMSTLTWMNRSREIEKVGYQDSLIAACESTILETMTALGIPGIPLVKIFPEIPPDWMPALLGVTVNEQALISLPGGENRLLASPGRLLQPGERPGVTRVVNRSVQSAVTGQDNPGVLSSPPGSKILTADPAILLGSEQTDALRRLLTGGVEKL
jgi:hypothetical protein